MIASIRPLILLGAALLLLVAAPGRACAAFTFTLTQAGANVVVSGSGTINTTALTLVSSSGAALNSQVAPSSALLIAGLPLGANYYKGGGLTGPTTFGTGATVYTSSSSGNTVGIYGASPEIFTPQNYTSGTQLTDSATFNNATFASLGFTPGTYIYTWGTGVNADSLIVTGGVPEPGTWLGGALLVVGASLTVRRRVLRRA